ncbi:hypothetical protein AAC387_Pa05g1339 [Persea americana]
MDRASKILALLSLAMSASYSASLLDALKPSVRACSMTRPSGDWRTMPAPALLDVEDPSTKTFQDESRSSLQDCSYSVSVTTSAPLSSLVRCRARSVPNSEE